MFYSCHFPFIPSPLATHSLFLPFIPHPSSPYPRPFNALKKSRGKENDSCVQMLRKKQKSIMGEKRCLHSKHAAANNTSHHFFSPNDSHSCIPAKVDCACRALFEFKYQVHF